MASYLRLSSPLLTYWGITSSGKRPIYPTTRSARIIIASLRRSS